MSLKASEQGLGATHEFMKTAFQNCVNTPTSQQDLQKKEISPLQALKGPSEEHGPVRSPVANSSLNSK